MELFSAKKFAAAALGVDDEAFLVHIASLLDSISEAKNVHPSRQAQIASLEVEEVTIPAEYSDYTDVFSPDSAAELPEHTGINNHPIDLTFQIARRHSDIVHRKKDEPLPVAFDRRVARPPRPCQALHPAGLDLTNTYHRMMRIRGGVREGRIEAAKTWLEPQSVRDIQVFIGFANFHGRFMQSFSKFAASLTSMLKTSPIDTRSELMEVVVDDEVIDGRKVVKGKKRGTKLPNLRR